MWMIFVSFSLSLRLSLSLLLSFDILSQFFSSVIAVFCSWCWQTVLLSINAHIQNNWRAFRLIVTLFCIWFYYSCNFPTQKNSLAYFFSPLFSLRISFARPKRYSCDSSTTTYSKLFISLNFNLNLSVWWWFIDFHSLFRWQVLYH